MAKAKGRKEKQGRDLEKLVEVLERVLGADGRATVESPARIRDRVTGRLREFDVVITGRVGHRDVKVAVECRDRRRPVGVGAVEAFVTKTSDCDVDRRVIVSSTGFREPARIKANARGIECVDLNRAEGFPWIRMQGIHYFKPKLRMHMQFNPGTPSNQKDFTVVDGDGNPITERAIADNILEALGNPSITDMPESGVRSFRFKIGGEGLYLRYTDDGSTEPVDHIIATGILTFSREFIPFQFVSMQMEGRERSITDAALANIDLGICDGTLAIITDPEDGRAKIVIATGPHKDRVDHPVKRTTIPQGEVKQAEH